MGEVTAERVDHGSDVEVGVGVDTAGHLELLNSGRMVCDDGHVVLSLLLNGLGSTRQQTVGQDSDGRLFAQAPMRSRSTDSGCKWGLRTAGRRIPLKTRSQSGEESDQQPQAPPHSHCQAWVSTVRTGRAHNTAIRPNTAARNAHITSGTMERPPVTGRLVMFPTLATGPEPTPEPGGSPLATNVVVAPGPVVVVVVVVAAVVVVVEPAVVAVVAAAVVVVVDRTVVVVALAIVVVVALAIVVVAPAATVVVAAATVVVVGATVVVVVVSATVVVVVVGATVVVVVVGATVVVVVGATVVVVAAAVVVVTTTAAPEVQPPPDVKVTGSSQNFWVTPESVQAKPILYEPAGRPPGRVAYAANVMAGNWLTTPVLGAVLRFTYVPDGDSRNGCTKVAPAGATGPTVP